MSISPYYTDLFYAGVYLPNLVQLRLNASVVPCVRDLGTSLSKVKVLWMPRCKLKDLDGLPALSNLRELYLAFNEVTDVSLITMLSYLEVLDLERWVNVVHTNTHTHTHTHTHTTNKSGHENLQSYTFLSISNNLSELDQLGYLSLCSSLISLNLEGNPLCTLLAEREVHVNTHTHTHDTLVHVDTCMFPNTHTHTHMCVHAC